MGALTPFTKWNPEDDLLLMNAVETGASLESLAKGAVNFSRRFTIRELEERWRSLLYDLNTSTKASLRILKIDIGVSVNNCSKPGRTCNSKVKDSLSGKRKGENLQCHYYAMRKRARSESHKSTNLGFLMPPNTHTAIVNDSTLHDSFELQNEIAHSKFPLSAPFSESYGHLETNYGVNQNAFPRTVELDSTAPSSSLAFHGSMAVSIDTELPVGISSNDCLCGHPENIPSGTIKEAGFHDAGDSFESNHAQNDLPHTLEKNHCSSHTSGVSKSTSAFHQLGYSSPPPGLPIWKTIEDVSTPTLQMDGQFVEKGQRILTTDCIKEMDDQSCDVAIPKSNLNDDTSAALDNSTILLEANFIDFSSSCMSFTDDEDLLLIDVDEDDIGDRSCLNGLGSIFLSSPTDTHIDNMPIPGEPMASKAFDIPDSITETSLKHEAIHEEIHNVSSNLHCSVVPGVNVLSSSPPGASLIESLSNCLLNTEDQDIPCNDDVIFPVKQFQAFPITNLRQDVSSTMTYENNATFGDSSLVKERKTSVQPFMAGHSLLPKVSLLHSAADCILESVPSDRDLISGASKVSGKVTDEPNSIPPAISLHHSQDLTQKKETLTDLNIQGSCMTSHTQMASTELGCVDLFPSISLSDQEEPTFESEDDDDDDVPNFSDIEAMILDMDLEACLFTKEEGTNGFRLKRPSSSLLSSRYQCIGTKKTIIRLEQGARSYMNRAISSHGAFAIFYGRNLKYFIRSIEVLIGRETEDIKVDIDLAKEGRANMISRRQAFIRMDEDGFFHLINVGKSSIFVNSKEVQARKRISLSSCDLIEIKDMRFIFEVNEVAVRRHINSSRQINHAPKSEFDFVCS